MYAVLNAYSEGVNSIKNSGEIKVYEGDFVVAIEDEFDLTKGRKYEVLNVNLDEVLIKPDEGVCAWYSVENFYPNLVYDKYDRRFDY